MTESQARLVDSLCKIIATVALVVGGGWTLYTYFNARAAEARTAAIEARKPFLAKRLEIYSEFVDLASHTAFWIDQRKQIQQTIESPGTNAQTKKNLQKDLINAEHKVAEGLLKFEDLNNGRLAMVEDAKVEESVRNFMECLRIESCMTPIEKAQGIAHATRDSIGTEWQVSISNSAITKADFEKQRH
jgi:hypothetical protein